MYLLYIGSFYWLMLNEFDLIKEALITPLVGVGFSVTAVSQASLSGAAEWEKRSLHHCVLQGDAAEADASVQRLWVCYGHGVQNLVQ